MQRPFGAFLLLWMDLLQWVQLNFIECEQVALQVACGKGVAVCGVDCFWCGGENRLPRLLELLQFFYPDGDSLEAREVVHGGIAAEEFVVD